MPARFSEEFRLDFSGTTESGCYNENFGIIRNLASQGIMSKDSIIIAGAREHNLKNIHLSLPREKLIVVTGLSGSGKSSLAFDTIYAEGQRKYVESLSAYARQFLEQLQKPDVDYIEGLSPAIAIEQRLAGSNPRSTIATRPLAPTASASTPRAACGVPIPRVRTA